MNLRALHILTLLIFACSGTIAQKKDTSKVNSGELLPVKRKFLYFVSNRMSEDDKYDLFKVLPSDREAGIIIIRGHVEFADDPSRKRARISVYNVSNNELVGIYNTNNYTGSYLMVLVPNIRYQFKIEAEGYEVMREIVEVPLKFDYEVGRQDIRIARNEKKKSVATVQNYFTDGNEKIFVLRTSIDSAKKESEKAGYAETDSPNEDKKSGNAYSTIDELVNKQLEEEKKKPGEALKAFKNKDYSTALGLYSELIKNDPAEPFINYYYGVCLLKGTRNRAKAISCLEIAAHCKDVQRDVYLHLAKACQLSYMFRDGMRALEEYKKYAKPMEYGTAEIIQLYNNCKSGNELMNEQVSFDVLRRVPTQADNLLANYNPEFINDKVMYKTDFFASAIDKKKGKQLMFKRGNSEVIHASYGAIGGNLDLFVNKVMPGGNVSPSQSLSADINTAWDEDYPYISKDGNTLYFCSKGLNSMGGYDIFKCTRTDSTMPWGKPENLGFPINSTYDDILFVPDPDGRYASFCTNRKSEKFEYIQIKTWHRNQGSSIIKGNFAVDSTNKSDALITVFNAQTDEIAGVYKTNSENGNYLMVLTSGQSYYMLVESEGYPELKSAFDISDKKSDFVLKQTIRLGKDHIKHGFTVTNYFTEEQAAGAVLEPKRYTKELPKPKMVEMHLPKVHRTPEEIAQDNQNLSDAKKLFDQENYQEAAVIYHNVEQHVELEGIHAYNYGVCLFYTHKDKAHCAQLLDRASLTKGISPDVYYYLGKANHMNYKFSAAIASFEKYNTLGKPSSDKKNEIDRDLTYCKNGIQLVNNPVVIEVFDKKHISLESVHLALTHLESGAKMLISTDDILSSVDKKKKYKPVIFLSPDKNTIYYSSYGESEERGKDIYRLQKMGNGKWSPVPLNVSNINSPFDEEYPALSPDGKTLYFSSKGFNTMGGYDIFQSKWNEETQTWSEPMNLGSPINSPFDDIYYVE